MLSKLRGRGGFVRLASIAAALLAGVLLVASQSFAQSNQTIITACVHKGGPLFIASRQCAQPNETELQWPSETAFQSLAAQVTVPPETSYTTAGSYMYTVPNGVHELKVEAWGGGGGGGGSVGALAGGGGGSGAYVKAVVSVTPGEQLTIMVGAAGVGGTGTNFVPRAEAGTNGGTSSVTAGKTVLVEATGGVGGGSGETGTAGAAGHFATTNVALSAAMTPGTAAQNAAVNCGTGTTGITGTGGGIPGTAGAGGNGGAGTCSIGGPFASGGPGQSGAVLLVPVTTGS